MQRLNRKEKGKLPARRSLDFLFGRRTNQQTIEQTKLMKNKNMLECPAVSRSTTTKTESNMKTNPGSGRGRTLASGTGYAAAILCALSLGAAAAHGGPVIFGNSAQISGDWLAFGYSNAYVDGDETTATYGETFIAPTLGVSDEVAVLNDWTFYLKQIPRNLGGRETAQSFEFFVMAWDGDKATGPILYESPRQTIAANDTTGRAFTVKPNVGLIAGKEYVIFINVSLQSNDNNARGSSLEMAGNGTGNVFYPPTAPSPLSGQFVYQYTPGQFATPAQLEAWLTTHDWATWAVDEYAAYNATFTGVR
jgi:hypothetical protein